MDQGTAFALMYVEPGYGLLETMDSTAEAVKCFMINYFHGWIHTKGGRIILQSIFCIGYPL
jgi:hypothetical protein